MSAVPFTIEPYPGRDGRSGEKIQVRARAADFPMRRAPKVEGYECYFVAYFGSEGEIVFSYRRTRMPLHMQQLSAAAASMGDVPIGAHDDDRDEWEEGA